MKLFHEKINVSIPAVRIPGVESGIIIFINVPKFDAPSISADSSNSLGTDSKYGIIIQIISGKDIIK